MENYSDRPDHKMRRELWGFTEKVDCGSIEVTGKEFGLNPNDVRFITLTFISFSVNNAH